MDALLNNAVELHYEGPVTLNAPLTVELRGRTGGISAMLWETLGAAGWVGKQTSPRMTVALRIGILPVAVPKVPARHLLDGGWTDEHGVRWHQRVGALNGRAAGPGFRLVEDQLQPGELALGEPILRVAAIEAGWLTEDSREPAEIPNVWITVAVARRNARWEAAGVTPI